MIPCRVGLIFSAVWLGAIVLSIPAAFVGAYLFVATKFPFGWQRVMLALSIGVVLAPFALIAAYLLPFTILVILPIVLIWAFFADRRYARDFR